MLTLTTLVGLALAGPWPELDTPPAGEPTPNDAAVLVAIEDYAFVADVPGARQNALDWHGWLTTSRGVPAERVELLLDAQATHDAVLRAVERRAAQVGDGGRLWVLFIGHGAPDASGHGGVLVGVDAQQTAQGLYARSLRRSDLLRAAGGADEAVVVLDTCFSGRTGDGMVAPGLQPVIPTTARSSLGVTVLSAGTADQFAGPLPGLGRPAFSYLALGALRGWADQDGDGVVRASEAVRFGRDTLMMLEEQTGRAQTPTLSGPDLELAAGAEEGPDVLSIAAGRSDALVLDIERAEYVETLEARHRELIAQREDELRRVVDAHARLVRESDAAWASLAGAGTLDEVQGFLDTWRGRRVVVEGVEHSFELPAVAAAESRLLELFAEEQRAREARQAQRDLAVLEQRAALRVDAGQAWAALRPQLTGGADDAPALVGFIAEWSPVVPVGDERVRVEIPSVNEARGRLELLYQDARPTEALAREAVYRMRYEGSRHEARRRTVNASLGMAAGVGMVAGGVYSLTRGVELGRDDEATEAAFAGHLLAGVELPIIGGAVLVAIPYKQWANARREARQKRQAWKAARVAP